MTDHLVCSLDVGSNVKGYNTEGSDRDVIHFVKSSKSSYIRHFTGLENVLKNRRDDTDEVHSDLLTGLLGVYKGNYPHLWVFGNEETLKDEPELLAFVQRLGSIRLKLILQHLARYGSRIRDTATKGLISCDAKTLLQILYNLSLVDYCLTRRSAPRTTTQLGMLHHLPSGYRGMFENLMVIRCVQRQDEKSQENSPLPVTVEETLKGYAVTIQQYREELWDRIECMPNPDEQPDLLKSITDFFLYDIPLPSLL